MERAKKKLQERRDEETSGSYFRRFEKSVKARQGFKWFERFVPLGERHAWTQCQCRFRVIGTCLRWDKPDRIKALTLGTPNKCKARPDDISVPRFCEMGWTWGQNHSRNYSCFDAEDTVDIVIHFFKQIYTFYSNKMEKQTSSVIGFPTRSVFAFTLGHCIFISFLCFLFSNLPRCTLLCSTPLFSLLNPPFPYFAFPFLHRFKSSGPVFLFLSSAAKPFCCSTFFSPFLSILLNFLFSLLSLFCPTFSTLFSILLYSSTPLFLSSLPWVGQLFSLLDYAASSFHKFSVFS